ncbi:hypothetical protein D3C71_1016910 [compost metagenome]
MRYDRQIPSYVKVFAVFVGLIGVSPVEAWPSDDVFSPRKRHVEMTAQQLARYSSHGVIKFELNTTLPKRPLTAVSVSIGYFDTDSRSQWGWLDTQEISQTGNVVSIRVPRLERSIPQSVQVSMRHGNEYFGSARVIVSTASNPYNGELSLNDEVIDIYGKDGVSIRATPQLSDGGEWRFSGVFLEDGGGKARTF